MSRRVQCGTDVDSSRTGRFVLSTDLAVGDASIGGYAVTVGAATVTCGGEGTVPIELACTGSAGSGATVTVR